jgi:hypothetical protein
MPSSLQAIDLTNPVAAASEINRELQTGTPSWFSDLPSDIQTYFITAAVAGPTPASSTSPIPTRAFSVASAFQKRPSITPAASSTNSGPASSQDQIELTTSAKIGIGIGVTIGACCIGVVVFAIIFIKRSTRQSKGAEEDSESRPSIQEKQSYHKHELDAVETSVPGAIQGLLRRNGTDEHGGVVHELAETNSLREVETGRVELMTRYG